LRAAVSGIAGAVLLAGCSSATKAPVEARTGRAAVPASGAHVVREGDTLYGIAWRYGLDFREIARWNRIGPPYVVHPGQQVRLQGPAVRREAAPEVSTAARRPGPPAPDRDRRTAGAAPAAVGAAASDDARGPVGWTWPARGRIVRRFAEEGSKGLDIAASLGAPVRAAAPGRVVYSGSGLVGYGKLIIVKHNNSYLSAYAHNDRLLVEEGESVSGGQHIAQMGHTGTQEVKLHFEIRRDGQPVDPLDYLPTSAPPKEDSDA
jgi:lipoprotein NlpD